jgi:hypothetical protein
MSKFENLLNTLWEDYNQPSQPTPPAGTNPAANNSTLAPSPSPTGANPTTASTTASPGTPNSINNQQNKSQPNPTQSIVDPNHNVIKAIAGITDPNKLAQFLKDPKNGVQLVATTNK